MYLSMPRSITILVSLLLISFNGFSQERVMTELALKQTGRQEKIYIHFDREHYLPGDTIWFKAYLFNGSGRSLLSTNVYFELLDQQGKVYGRAVTPVFESTASGHLNIPPDPGINRLFCRAYTISMLNDTNSVDYRELSVVRPQTVGKKNREATDATVIKFLPEGGNWVNGLPSLMAFKATGANGMPVNASGTIKKGSTIVTRFNTVHNGMGSFVIMPVTGDNYTAEWSDDKGNTHRTALPVPKPSGIVLHIADIILLKSSP